MCVCVTQVKRGEANGGDKVYTSLTELEEDYRSGALHPGVLTHTHTHTHTSKHRHTHTHTRKKHTRAHTEVPKGTRTDSKCPHTLAGTQRDTLQFYSAHVHAILRRKHSVRIAALVSMCALQRW